MSNRPLVSAIITTHNRIDLLKIAVKSVYDQTYENIELIVVDDHSEDGTEEWCKLQNFKYIKIPKEKSKGGNYARNLGIKASQGEYVAFLDDDDYWLPEKISKQLDIINNYDCELVYAGCKLEIIDKYGTKTYRYSYPNPEHWGDMSKKILLSICTTTTLIFVKRQALLDVGMFDEELKFWQEYELTIRLAQRKPFYWVNEPLAVYRINQKDKNRLTNKYYNWKKSVNYIHKKHSKLYDGLNLWERIGIYTLVWSDAKGRALSSGLKYHYIKYSFLCLLARVYNFTNIIASGRFEQLKNKFFNV